MNFDDLNALRSYFHELNHNRAAGDVGTEGSIQRNIVELANEEYTRMHMKETGEQQGFFGIPEILFEKVAENGTGYAKEIKHFRNLSVLLDGTDAEYRRFMADVVQSAEGKDKKKPFP